ncbi:hypothetical protein [Pseudonocardia endophytica]|uniref:ATP-binding protein n=1 Tax=Pseudonocardia endophytica TaxID=401976 RepID=A0A4R1HJA3_PSEEN|nr:hypothetical protein [Pseudonocardia endophytica]TCK21061.1 hypothetical protein EV378_5036 [Pseudonocardia endophytica]
MRRDLASRAVLIAAGVGTALGAGAGLANAAPLEQDLQQGPDGQNAFDQSLPTDALTGAVPQAPNLSVTDGLANTQALPTAGLPVSADALTGLAGNGLLSDLGSNGGNVDQGATDQATPATDQAQRTADTGSDSGSDS